MSEPILSMDVCHELFAVPRSPKTLEVRVYAASKGECGASRPRKAYDMPAELLGMDNAEFMAHPWTAFLIAEAKTDLEARIEAKRLELAS